MAMGVSVEPWCWIWVLLARLLAHSMHARMPKLLLLLFAGAAITYGRNSYNGSCHSTGGMEDGAWHGAWIGVWSMGIRGMGMDEDTSLNSMFGQWMGYGQNALALLRQWCCCCCCSSNVAAVAGWPIAIINSKMRAARAVNSNAWEMQMTNIDLKGPRLQRGTQTESKLKLCCPQLRCWCGNQPQHQHHHYHQQPQQLKLQLQLTAMTKAISRDLCSR